MNEIKKVMKSNFEKEMVNKEKDKSSFDWLLFMFLSFIIALLALAIAK
jgi:hypothetical protein